MLNKIRAALDLWRTELEKLERELEKKLQRLAYLQEAPLPANEVADAMVDYMTGVSDHYFHLRLADKLGNFLRKPLRNWRTVQRLADTRDSAARLWKSNEAIRKKYADNYDSFLNREFCGSEVMGMPQLIGGGQVDPHFLFWALREPLGEAIKKAIIEWPGYPKSGPPLAERQKEIAQLEKAIPKMQQQIEASRQEAQVVGVDVGGLHQRPPVPKRTRDLKK